MGVALAAGAVLASPASAAFGPSFNLSALGANASGQQVAVSAQGSAAFVWQRSDGSNFRIQTRTRSAGGALSAVQNLSAAGQDAVSPQVAVDDSGTAIFVWERFDGSDARIQTRTRSAAGALSAVQDLSAAGESAGNPLVEVDGDGDAVFTWDRFDGSNDRVQTRTRSAAGTLNTVQNLSPVGSDSVEPQLGVTPGGAAVFTWEQELGDVRVVARARSAAGTLSAVQNLSAAGEDGTYPHIGVADNGDAVVMWQRSDGSDVRVQARERSVAGTLSAVQDLSPSGGAAISRDVGVDPGGDAVFVWDRFNGSTTQIQTRARSAAGALSAVQNVSAPGQPARDPHLGVDDRGRAVIVWRRFDGSSMVCCHRIQARERSAAGTLSAVQNLDPSGANADDPEIAVNPGGVAFATWQFPSDPTLQVQGAGAPAPPSPPSPPSNEFTIVKVKGKKLKLEVPGPGAVDVADAADARRPRALAAAKGLKPSSATAAAAGEVTVKLKLKKKADKKLKRKGKVKVNAAIAYTPTGGEASTQTSKLKLKKKKKG